MDEMKITSKFTTNVISKIMQNALRKQLGYNVVIQLNELKASIADGKTHVHIDIDAELDKEDLLKILASNGLS